MITMLDVTFFYSMIIPDWKVQYQSSLFHTVFSAKRQSEKNNFMKWQSCQHSFVVDGEKNKIRTRLCAHTLGRDCLLGWLIGLHRQGRSPPMGRDSIWVIRKVWFRLAFNSRRCTFPYIIFGWRVIGLKLPNPGCRQGRPEWKLYLLLVKGRTWGVGKN